MIVIEDIDLPKFKSHIKHYVEYPSKEFDEIIHNCLDNSHEITITPLYKDEEDV